jgi:putative SOS response-associated peptidase YedK
MCGRFALHSNPDVVALQFGLGQAPQFAPRYNIPPSSAILAVGRNREGRRVAATPRWGLIPSWAKDPSIGNRLANARAETVAEKPAFRKAFQRGRCLVPADGFYEWKTSGGRKHPWYIKPKEGGVLFGLAAIAERWAGPEGPVQTVCLITTAPNALMARIHDRMPVIVAPADYAAWLDPANARAGELLRSYPDADMEAWPVSRRVNAPKNDDPALILPEAGLDSGG